MNEEQVIYLEKLRGYLVNLRGQGIVITGQAVFEQVSPNTMSKNARNRVVVTNNDGTYLFSLCDTEVNGLPPVEVFDPDKKPNLPLHSRHAKPHT